MGFVRSKVWPQGQGGCLSLRLLFTLCVLGALPIYAPIREAKPFDICDREVFQQIKQASAHHKVDLALALAVAQVESKFDTLARGSHGEVGLFQLMRLHGTQRHTVASNIYTGVSLLVATRGRDTVATLRYYNGGTKWQSKPQTAVYARKVLTVRRQVALKLELKRRAASLEALVGSYDRL